jgi:effector-binding domain-containing protein
MIDTPHLTDSAEQFAAVIHLDIPRTEMMQAFGPAVNELLAALAAQGIAPQGAAFAHHLAMTPERFDFELGFFVDTAIVATGRVRPGVLRAARVARTVYHGAYEGLPDAWGEFIRWIETHGHTPAADLWEWYVVGPHLSLNPADWRTELSRPLIG